VLAVPLLGALAGIGAPAAIAQPQLSGQATEFTVLAA
jgi:hypothetical protein